MIKDIKYGGYTAQPSDYECQDGDLSLSLNLIAEDNQIKTLGQPDLVLTLQEGERVLFIHSVPNQKIISWHEPEQAHLLGSIG